MAEATYEVEVHCLKESEKEMILLAISSTIDDLKEKVPKCKRGTNKHQKRTVENSIGEKELLCESVSVESDELTIGLIESMMLLKLHRDSYNRRKAICERLPQDRRVVKKLLKNLMKLRNIQSLCGEDHYE